MTWPTTRFPTGSEIFDRLREFAANPGFAPMCSVASLAEPTGLGAQPNSVRIGGATGPPGSGNRIVVVITGGVHAREWAPPVALVNFIENLLSAALAGSSITAGSTSRTAVEVQAILRGVDLFVAPLINPDGYDFSQTTDRLWRKNRRPAPASLPAGCVAPDAVGVDINRNFDVLWSFNAFYVDPAAVQSSTSPCEEVFIGGAAFSEPESRNVRALLQTNEPAFFVDVHMFGSTILHSWGVEQNAPIAGPTPVLDPNRVRDGTSTAAAPFFNNYREPIDQDFLRRIQALAGLMADATRAASGNRYKPQAGADAVSISGAADDFAFSRNLGTLRPPVIAYTVECGRDFVIDFATELPAVQAEVHAALLALLAFAVTPSGATAATGTTSSGASSCRSCGNCSMLTTGSPAGDHP